jgi:hypothetical protein
MDRHFTAAGVALTNAANAIAATTSIKDVSTDGDNDSAEIIFSVDLEGKEKTYILKLVELDDPEAEK